MGFCSKTLLAIALLYNSSLAQMTKSVWEVKVPFFLAKNTEAVLEYDIDKGRFDAHANIEFSFAGKVASFFSTGLTGSLDVKVHSSDVWYNELYQEWRREYAAFKASDTVLKVIYHTHKGSKSYELPANLWTDAGQAFIQMMKEIKEDEHKIGDRVPYKIHSSGDTISVFVDFVASDEEGYDFCSSIRAQNGKDLFGMTERIDVFFKDKEPRYVKADVFFMSVKGRLKYLSIDDRIVYKVESKPNP